MKKIEITPAIEPIKESNNIKSKYTAVDWFQAAFDIAPTLPKNIDLLFQFVSADPSFCCITVRYKKTGLQFHPKCSGNPQALQEMVDRAVKSHIELNPDLE